MPRLDIGRDDLEDLVGGRVLAWVGGVAVLLGIVFLFALAVSNGWIGETARVLLAGAGSLGLLGLGVWLHERKARTDAALASVATGISGLFVTVTVAAQVYDLLPQLPAVGLAIGVGVVATALALLWESRGIAALGILGGLSAPILAGVAGDGGTMLILFVTLAAAAGVVLWQRWDWLALLAYAIAMPQWVEFLSGDASSLEELAVLIGFGALGVAVAVGHELRIKADRLRGSSAYLLALNALVVSVMGWVALDAGNAWLAGVAVAHLVVGMLSVRSDRVSDDLRFLALVIGVVLADVAFGAIVDGPALAVGWAATGVGFAALYRSARKAQGAPAAGILAQAGLGGHLALAMVSALSVSDPAVVLGDGAELTAGGALAVAALAAGCLVSARIAERDSLWKVVLDSVGLASIALLTALSLDGLQLVLAWIAEVVMLAVIARRTGEEPASWGALGFLALAGIHVIAVEAPPVALSTGVDAVATAAIGLSAVAGALVLIALLTPPEADSLGRVLKALAALTLLYMAVLLLSGLVLVLALTGAAAALAAIASRADDEVAGVAALGFLATAGVHTLVYEARPVSLVTGLADPLAAVAAVGGIVACLVLMAMLVEERAPEVRTALRAAAWIAALYLASALVVTPFESDAAVDSALLSAHQQGQMVLSVFWGLVGVGTIFVGLRRDLHVVRLAGLTLLAVTIGKLFLFDLSTLTSIYRVVSFIALGVLLLGGGLVWQRLRPRVLSDLRETPAGVR